MQKTLKMTETLALGYSYESTQRELSNEYQHDRVMMIFITFFLFVHLTKVTPASEGLSFNQYLDFQVGPVEVGEFPTTRPVEFCGYCQRLY